MEEQKVQAQSMYLCCLALNFTQEKTATAEEEVALLEEQSQHYKDELDKALRQIEKLNANSQSVGHMSFQRYFCKLIASSGWSEVAFTWWIRQN